MKSARIIGALFIIAIAASLAGGTLVNAALSSADFIETASADRLQLLTGILLELVNALCVVGIGTLMFPVLRKRSESAARGYLVLRVLEAVFCCAIVIAPLALVRLDAEAAGEGTLTALIATRAAINSLLIPVLFCMGAVLLYMQLYRTGLLPRFITVWGFIAVVLIFVLNIIGLFLPEMGAGMQMTLGLPIILNEVFMGFWLIAKGFKATGTEAPTVLNLQAV